MEDLITIKRISLLHPSIRQEVTEIYKEICDVLTGRAICRFSYTLRTFAEQDALYAIGRRGIDGERIITNARGGLSFHCYGLGVDIVLLKDTDGNRTFETASWETDIDFDGDGQADWIEVVTIFKQYGWEAGIDWKFRDAGHFQKPMGMSVRQLLFQVQNKHLVPGTNYPLLIIA